MSVQQVRNRLNGARKAHALSLGAAPDLPPELAAIKGRWEWITPDLAAAYLEVNYEDERKIRWGVVARYAADMLNGYWVPTHLGVAFDTEENRIDGQHRLWAIIKADKPVWMLVFWDVPVSARRGIDGGLVRSARDIGMAPWMNQPAEAVARRMLTGIQTGSVGTRIEVCDFANLHEAAIRYAMVPDKGPVRRAVFRAAMACAWYHEDHAMLDALKAAIETGYHADPLRARTATTLVRSISMGGTGGAGGGAGARRDEYLKMQRAIHAFCRGELLTKLYAPAELIYAVPESGAPG